jgi:hypothetical protein
MDWITLTHREIENDDLPSVCIHCGAEASARHNQTFEWHPEWAGWLLLAGFFPGLIAISLTSRKRRVSLPVCLAHHPDAPSPALRALGRTAFLLLAALSCIPMGMAALLLVARAGGSQADLNEVLLYGGLGGAVVGLALALGIVLTRRASRPEAPAVRPARALVVQRISADGISFEGVDDAFVRAVRARRQGAGDITLPAEGSGTV